MRKFPMPCLLWHACELVNYRLKPTTQFLCCLLLCLSATATMPGSASRMDSVSLHSRTVDSCDTAGCQECLPATTPTTRPYFRSALTRSVYSKILVDEEFKKFDRTKVNPTHTYIPAHRHSGNSHICKVTSHSQPSHWWETLGCCV